VGASKKGEMYSWLQTPVHTCRQLEEEPVPSKFPSYQKSQCFHFHMTIWWESKLLIRIWMNPQDSFSTRLPTQSRTHSQRCTTQGVTKEHALALHIYTYTHTHTIGGTEANHMKH
jgi:hypothetical protein